MRSESLDASADLSLVRADLDTRPDDGRPAAGSPDLLQISPATPVVVAGDRSQTEPVVAPHRAGRVSRLLAEVPLGLVIAGVGVGLVVLALHHFRWGSLAISVSVLAGGVLRLVLPARKAGLLVVRSRLTDVVVMGLLGGALMVLAAVTST